MTAWPIDVGGLETQHLPGCGEYFIGGFGQWMERLTGVFGRWQAKLRNPGIQC